MNKKQQINFDEIQKLFKECDVVDDKIIIKTDFIKWATMIKETYEFDFLEEINAVEHNNGEIELIYTFYSKENDESLVLAVFVKNVMKSFQGLFYNAEALEKIISESFNIKFEP